MVKRQNAIFVGYMLAFAAVYLGSVAYSLSRSIFGFGLFGSNVVVNEQQTGATNIAYTFSFGSLLPLFVIVIALMATFIFFSFKSFKRASEK